MKLKKIGIIMKKSKTRDKILINLQKSGYRVYVIPEGDDIKDTVKNMELSLIIIGKTDEFTFIECLDILKSDENIIKVPVVILVDKNIANADIVKILKKGATDVVYVKDENVFPVLNMVEKFWTEKRTKFDMRIREIDEVCFMRLAGTIDASKSFRVQSEALEMIKNEYKIFV